VADLENSGTPLDASETPEGTLDRAARDGSSTRRAGAGALQIARHRSGRRAARHAVPAGRLDDPPGGAPVPDSHMNAYIGGKWGDDGG